MKIKDLVEILQGYDGEMEVLIDTGHDEFPLMDVIQEAMLVQDVSFSKHNDTDIRLTVTVPMYYRKEFEDPVKCLVI